MVDDGSTDGTSDVLARRYDVHIMRHSRNLGYGAVLGVCLRPSRKIRRAGDDRLRRPAPAADDSAFRRREPHRVPEPDLFRFNVRLESLTYKSFASLAGGISNIVSDNRPNPV